MCLLRQAYYSANRYGWLLREITYNYSSKEVRFHRLNLHDVLLGEFAP